MGDSNRSELFGVICADCAKASIAFVIGALTLVAGCGDPQSGAQPSGKSLVEPGSAIGPGLAGRQLLSGHVLPEMLQNLFSDRMEQSNRLTVTIGLPVRDPEGLARAVSEVSDPKSQSFRQYLTPEEFADRYGASPADYQKVLDWAGSHGLAVEKHTNRLVVAATGKVDDIEEALHVQMKYGRRADSSQFYAPDREPSVDLDVPVAHIGGLDNFTVARHGSSGGSSPAFSGYIFGQDYRHAYASCTTLDGTGQSVGIVSLGNGFLASDISAYRTAAGLPGPAATVNGTAGPGGDGEDTGDIETVLSMAPAAQIVEFRGSLDAILTNMAAHPEIKQMTSSYFPGNISSTARNALAQMAMLGQSFFNLTSDAGAFTANQIGGTNDMRGQPNVTLVGGTDLNMSGSGTVYVSESTWPQSGGGILSNVVNNTGVGTPIPSYQIGLATTANGGSNTFRNAPDVSMNSDTIDLIVNGAHGGWAGTSFSTPLWAGFMALVNQQAQANGLPTVGFANPALYEVASSGYAANFNDVTTGSNPSIPGGSTTFNATAGYDLTTGLGTPKCALITTLSTPLTLAAAPSVNARGSGVLEIFGLKTDNSVIHRTYNAGFGAWQAMPPITALSAPASVSWATNRIDVVVLGSSGEIEHTWWNQGGSFANWENLGCCFDSGPAISSWGAQRLDVFSQSRGVVFHRAFDGTNGWLDWENIGGSVSSAPAAVSWGNGRIDVFARGTGTDLVHTWFNNPNWSGLWESLSCCFDTAPSAASWASGRLDVFENSGGTLYHQFYNAGWSGLENLSGPIGSAPSATSWASGRIDVMSLTSGNQLIHKFYNNPSGWSGFETLGTLLYESP